MKTTKTKIVTGILAVAVIAAAVKIYTLWEKPTPRSIVLEITGAQDQQVTVRLEADGESLTTTNTIPTRVPINAHRLSWEIATIIGPDKPRFRVAVHVDGQQSAGGFAEGDRVLEGGLVGAEGLRRQRAWHGRYYE